MAGDLVIRLDGQGIARIEAALARAGREAANAIRRAINWVGDRVKTRVVDTLTPQTGLRRGTILRAVKPTRANYGALIYRLRAVGGDVALKYFGARETRAGVSAAPWGKRQVFAGAFIKGGAFPARVPLAMGGQVFERVGTGRLPIKKAKSGLFIPEEMVKGQSLIEFETAVATLLPPRVEHEVGVILQGIA